MYVLFNFHIELSDPPTRCLPWKIGPSVYDKVYCNARVGGGWLGRSRPLVTNFTVQREGCPFVTGFTVLCGRKGGGDPRISSLRVFFTYSDPFDLTVTVTIKV